MTSGDKREWFEAAFDREYLDIYAHRNDEDAARALNFLVDRDVIHPGDAVLDLCCGNGRHSAALQRFGCHVFGFDLSLDLLRDFQSSSDGSVPLVRGDMRRLTFGRAFDAVVNLFTSFGYFDDDEENWQVIRDVAGVLKPTGRYVLDFLNAELVRSTLTPQSERELANGFSVREARRIERGRVVKSVELVEGGTVRRQWEESVRLLTRPEIEAAMVAAGFAPPHVFGDFDGSTHSAESPRTILVAILAD